MEQHQTETAPLTNSTEGSTQSSATPRTPEQRVSQPALNMAEAIQQQRSDNNPDQVLEQVAKEQPNSTKPINPPGIPLSITQIEEGKRLIAAGDKGEKQSVSRLGLNPQQQDDLIAAVRNYQAQVEPLRVDKTLSLEEQARQGKAAAAAHGVAVHASTAAGKNLDTASKTIIGSDSLKQTKVQRPDTTRTEQDETRMVHGPDGVFIPEQQVDNAQKAEIGRVTIGNMEIPVYSEMELSSLSRANEITHQPTGHAENLQELQAIIGGMESLNRESFSDDDVYNQGLAVVMREMGYWDSARPVTDEEGAIVDGKIVKTEIIKPEVVRPSAAELQEAWRLMDGTSRGKVMEMLAYLQDYQAVATGNLEPYQMAMPESRKAEINSKVNWSSLIGETQANRAVYEKQRDEDLRIITEEMSSLSPSEIQQEIEEFTRPITLIEEDRRIQRIQAKAIAETVGKMVEVGRAHGLGELLEMASYYYGGFRAGTYPDKDRFSSLPRIARFNLDDIKQISRSAVAAVRPVKLNEAKLFIAFQTGNKFAELPVESRIEFMAHEYQHILDYNSGLIPAQESQDLEKSAITEMNAFAFQYEIYKLLKRYFPALTSPSADFFGERLKEGQASALRSALNYAQIIRDRQS